MTSSRPPWKIRLNTSDPPSPGFPKNRAASLFLSEVLDCYFYLLVHFGDVDSSGGLGSLPFYPIVDNQLSSLLCPETLWGGAVESNKDLTAGKGRNKLRLSQDRSSRLGEHNSKPWKFLLKARIERDKWQQLAPACGPWVIFPSDIPRCRGMCHQLLGERLWAGLYAEEARCNVFPGSYVGCVFLWGRGQSSCL